MNERRVWRAAPRTLALVWVFIGVAIAALPLLAITLLVRGGDEIVAVVLLALTVVAVGYGWRFGLHPRMTVDDDRLVIRNPWRTVRLPLASIVSIEPGENGIRVATDDREHEVWCVQKSTSSTRSGRTERADRVVTELGAYLAAATTTDHDHRSDDHHINDNQVDRHEDDRYQDKEDDQGDDCDDEPPELLIHRATHDDAGTLAALERRASEAALRHVFAPTVHPYPLDDVTSRWQRQLGDRSVRARIAELDGEPIGYLAYRDDQILHLGVLPSHQGRGFGRDLVDYAAADILRQHEAVTLWVLRDNVGALGFYRAYGFVDTDQERLCEFPPQPVEVKMLLARR